MLLNSVTLWDVFMWNVPQNVLSKKTEANIVAFRDGVVGNISACHADARGSIPRRGASFFGLCALFVDLTLAMGWKKNLRNSQMHDDHFVFMHISFASK